MSIFWGFRKFSANEMSCTLMSWWDTLLQFTKYFTIFLSQMVRLLFSTDWIIEILLSSKVSSTLIDVEITRFESFGKFSILQTKKNLVFKVVVLSNWSFFVAEIRSYSCWNSASSLASSRFVKSLPLTNLLRLAACRTR